MTPEGNPILLYACSGVDDAAWREALKAAMPELSVRRWPVVGDPALIDYALVWRPPAGVLGGLPNLRAIFSLGAGVEHLLADPTIPAHLPLVRMVDPALEAGMREYVLMRVLHYHRQIPSYAASQGERRWTPLHPKLAEEQRVSVLGLGALGGACASALTALGFDVAGWSRSPKTIPGVRSYSGADGLRQLLARTDILVCLLPLTAETDGILDASAFAVMPEGGYLINVARGRHVVEADLIAALAGGRLAGATLDVFDTEPLPAEHPFWGDPAITVTPHISSVTHPGSAARAIAEGVRRDLAGLPLRNLVDRARGY